MKDVGIEGLDVGAPFQSLHPSILVYLVQKNQTSLMAYLRTYNTGTNIQDVELPFDVKFNFEKIIAYWKKVANSEHAEMAAGAKQFLERLRLKAPALLGPFDDLSLIELHQEEFKALLAPLFPELTTLNEMKGVMIPFLPIIFNATQRLTNIMDVAEEDEAVIMRQDDPSLYYINACIFILKFKYGAKINNKRAFYFDIPNKKTGIIRHYRAFINADFSSFKLKEGFKVPSPDEIRTLINNFSDVDLWKEKIPPNSFTYEGFALISLFDITEEEAISALKADLLKKGALQSPQIVSSVRQHLSSLLGVENLKVGFAAYDKEKDTLKSLGYGFWNSLSLSGEIEEASQKAFCHNSHNCLFLHNRNLIYASYQEEDLVKTPLLPRLKANNINSYIAIPLEYDKKIIGVFELGAAESNQLNSVVASHVEPIIPLITTALKRTLDEIETALEVIVQEQFTSIHPSVSWRFFDAAENLLKQKQGGTKATIEEIIFPEVYPLYGQSDIKGSSTERNNAIQADMIEQLNLAKDILELAITKYHLPIYNQLRFKLVTCIRQMKKGLGAGDEIEVLEFLKRDIYPVFGYFRTLGTEMDEAVEEYKLALNEALGVIYNKRKDYEQSVRLINNGIAEHLRKAQVAAQDMFPHYFEKYKTDGVEHNIYIGASIVNNNKFNELHLQNLRLWQLMTICETEHLMEFELKPQLKLPLNVASLILVHHNPITIKFRQEEKRFDVEGAYNIRYEIIKKRIDKATIKGTQERLTQARKIAIVYTQDKEAREYRQYLDYLQSIQYITKDLEWLDLNDLQGVTGLKAIRIAVNFKQSKKKVKFNEELRMKNEELQI